MKRKLLSAVMVCALSLVGCGGDDKEPEPNPQPTQKFDTPAKIQAHLEGKTLVMEGVNVPSHPNGLNEDTNYGSASQCYEKVSMNVSGGNFAVTSTLGTLRNAATVGATGECEPVAAGTPLSFTSTAVLIENVQGDGECFDISVTYPSFKQVGRGKLSDGGNTLTLELYFENQAVGATCAAGAVGSTGVKVNNVDFTGNSKQVYTVLTALPSFDTAEKIKALLEGKKLVMEGANIPSHPNGFNEDTNYGSATQCYTKSEMTVSGGNLAVTSNLGTLRDAPNVGNTGTCDHTVVSGTPLSFTSTAVLIENVKSNGACFDISVTYPSFKQAGRGKLSGDGKTLTLEIFFENQAVGANCAAGVVGSRTVKLNNADFTGNARQVYAVSAAQ
ncbi:hypothetical protein [Hyalangium minutum]|uniref:Putative lipoprotein n=1 Tax=Hyalangium minutum TaxID=394096 RepID=A0A085WKX4_9BACT|nr:hypothetical protein [Hyalangium minutum]KFE68337.1 putative lipoprotein [Hyalangium minutum]